jgi:virulence factor Mce-like protein
VRRLAAIALAAAAAVVLLTFATGAGSDDDGATKYRIEFDNAFGIVDGADVKIAGVRAGKVKKLNLDRDDLRAVVDVEIQRKGFGDLREDAYCEARPQSLIGEYFIDCKPGTSSRKLDDGGLVPVRQTSSTVPVDLVTNIMRRPYRERFAIIYNELGAGLAARGDDLNETIRRASPALREVDRVLKVLAEQRRTIRDLYDDADRVVGELAKNRKDVTRFVREARDTAKVSATRTQYVKRNFQLLPRFLNQLRPTVKLLGESSVRQEGALRNLNANAGRLEQFLGGLGDFAQNSRPAIKTLGDAAEQGRFAAKAAVPRVDELRVAAKPLPEAAQNFAITLEHLDDRKFATEKDYRSPGGEGYTGLEAVLRFVFAQSQAINLFDDSTYILKVAAFLDYQCARFINATDAKDKANDKCAALLGPNRPGINQPDPTATAPAKARTKSKGKPAPAPAAKSPATAAPAPQRTGPKKDIPKVQLPPEVQKLLDELLPGGKLPGGLGGLLGGLGGAPSNQDAAAGRLLDFLMAP